MSSILIIDGVKYRVWSPDSEERLEGMVKEHSREIFGSESFYFDIRRKIRTRAGIGSIPDGYVIDFSGKQSKWFVVEVELSS
ncbi:TPA: hypothetical protein EYP27_02255, partial [Candidatus Bathyarchaeota archaeon]|nr:hypothetical protein [Candidatus Bathyarchaeota archaeon]